MPRGYLIPAELIMAEKLRTHNIQVEVLAKPVKASGEEFVIDKVGQARGGGFEMSQARGWIRQVAAQGLPGRDVPGGHGPAMANAAFYYLEPQAADGFVGLGCPGRLFQSHGGGQEEHRLSHIQIFQDHRVKGRVFGSPLARGLKPRASTAAFSTPAKPALICFANEDCKAPGPRPL